MSDIPTPGLIPEWAPQCATMLVWPNQDTDWGNSANDTSPSLLADISNTYVDLTHTICKYQPTLIICKNTTHENHIRHQLNTSKPNSTPPKYPAIFVIAPYNDTWCRDFGPLSVWNNTKEAPEVGEGIGLEIELLDFRFNGWGNKYASNLDDQLCRQLSQQKLFNKAITSTDFALEGGSIDGNGGGLLLTTKACLLSETRNKGFNQSDIEMQLRVHLGCKKILWLSEGKLIGDDTDSHVDNLARFVNPTTVVYASCTMSNDAHYSSLQAMEKELHQLNDNNRLGLNLIPVPIPEPIIDKDTGSRLPGSYINFILVNNAVIVPTFGVPEDALALKTYASIFPTRDIHSVIGNHLIRQFGGPHCASMQLPLGIIDIDMLSVANTNAINTNVVNTTSIKEST